MQSKLNVIIVIRLTISSHLSALFILIARRKGKVFTDVHEAQTWYGARDKCANLGLKLLTINSQQKSDEMAELLQELNETYVELKLQCYPHATSCKLWSVL